MKKINLLYLIKAKKVTFPQQLFRCAKKILEQLRYLKGVKNAFICFEMTNNDNFSTWVEILIIKIKSFKNKSTFKVDYCRAIFNILHLQYLYIWGFQREIEISLQQTNLFHFFFKLLPLYKSNRIFVYLCVCSAISRKPLNRYVFFIVKLVRGTGKV